MAKAETRVEADTWLDERRFVALIEHAYDITTVLSLDSTVQYMSPAAERILGYPVAEMIGRSNIELIHPDDRWELRRAFAASLRSGTASPPVELRFRHQDGSWRWLEVVATNRLRDPEIGGIIVNSRDVTARKEADQRLREAIATAEEASRLKSEFLSTMSHELRTPMNAIIGYAHLLLDGLSGDLTEQQTNDVDQIARSGERLLALINDLLDISKIEAGRMELSLTTVDIGDIVRRVRDELAPAAAAKGLEIEIDLLDRLPELEADPVRLHQILLNLIGNAVKFTPQGRVAILVETSEDRIAVSVVDTGIGIVPGALEFIFDEFRQADGSTTRRFGGTGLGLAIARKLARLHGGNISVISSPGAGSTFTLMLPIVARDQTPPTGIKTLSPQKEFAG